RRGHWDEARDRRLENGTSNRLRATIDAEPGRWLSSAPEVPRWRSARTSPETEGCASRCAIRRAAPSSPSSRSTTAPRSPLAPLAIARAVETMNRVLPSGVLQVAIGAAETGAALVDHVDMVCVTGSPETGRRVMERASRRLTPVLLELGGKDPMIVLGDADLDRAASAAAWGGCT